MLFSHCYKNNTVAHTQYLAQHEHIHKDSAQHLISQHQGGLAIGIFVIPVLILSRGD